MSIASKAMFAALNQRVWQAASADRGIAARVENENEAEHRSMRVVKKLAPVGALLPITRLANFGKEQHDRMTLPGLMRGQQLLATKMFDEYAYTQSKIRENFYLEVERFSKDIYPSIVKSAPVRLGRAFRATDFPDEKRISSYFSYEVRFLPVPDGDNWFLHDLSEASMDDLRNKVEQEKNSLFREATKDLMERTQEVLENLIGQLDTFDEDKASGKLREVTISTVKDMAALVCRMNITEDPMLNVVGKEMVKKFENMEASSLRKNKDEREAMSTLAKNLLERLKR